MKRAFFFFFLLSLAFRQYAQISLPANLQFNPPADLQTDFQRALQVLSQDSSMRHASWGFYAIDINTGQMVAEYNPQAFLLPASGLKVVTTASALAILGEKFCYKTDLFYVKTQAIFKAQPVKTGELVKTQDMTKQPVKTEDFREGVFRCSLILRASGDPSLGSLYQENTVLIDSLLGLYANSIQKVGGKENGFALDGVGLDGFTLDNTVFKANPPETWEFGDLAESYGAVADGFMLNENVLELKIKRTMARERRPFISSSYPKLLPNDYLNFKFTSLPNDGNAVNLDDYLAKKTVKGEIAAGSDSFSLRIANTTAASYFTGVFLNKIAASGKLIDNKLTPRIIDYENKYTATNRLNYDSTHLLYSHSSPTLSALVKRCNERSVNIYAEAFLKTIGLKAAFDGTTEAGIAALTSYWKKRKVELEGLNMVDGSGLSRHNAVTPFFMANFMRTVWLDKKIAEPFYLSLPIAGETGTLEKWFQDAPAKGKIRAKTGSMSGVLSYTGYAPRSNGSTIAFCLIVNHYSGKANDMRKKLTWVLGKLVEI